MLTDAKILMGSFIILSSLNISLLDIFKLRNQPTWLPLKGTESGSLKLEVQWFTLTPGKYLPTFIINYY